jgi:cytochrome c553
MKRMLRILSLVSVLVACSFVSEARRPEGLAHASVAAGAQQADQAGVYNV